MSLHEQGVVLRPPEWIENATAADDRRRAGTFFLGWLILAASMSVAGNVGHALLIAPAETRWLAALAALVPPIVLLAATHSATWLVRARSIGWVYWVALALTAALALGSFALSFDALRSFAVMLGIRESMSWIWPAVIDVAIAHATLCLLSLTRPKRDKGSVSLEDAAAAVLSGASTRVDGHGAQSKTEESAGDPHQLAPSEIASPSRTSAVAKPRPSPTADALDGDAASAVHRGPERALSAVRSAGATAAPRGVPPRREREAAECEATLDRWQPVAESLVRDGITNKDPDLIAKILADNAAGTPPSTIGRRHEVHHTTVSRILSAAEQFTEASTATG